MIILLEKNKEHHQFRLFIVSETTGEILKYIAVGYDIWNSSHVGFYCQR
jgi:hypothetical protein